MIPPEDHWNLSERCLHVFYQVVVKLMIWTFKIYDVVTLPLYCLIQSPWDNVERARRVRATRENLALPTSPYYRIGQHRMHYLKTIKTIPEAQKQSLQYNDSNVKSLGYREILEIREELQLNGKKMKKFVLTDYHWLTIGQVDQLISQLESAFRNLGVREGQRVLIFAETRIEWFLCAHAVFRIGAAIVTLYASLGPVGVSYGIMETELSVVVTTEELVDKLPKDLPSSVNSLIYFSSPVLRGKSLALEELRKEGKVRVLSYEQFLELASEEAGTYQCPAKEDTPAVILYTSGSTGKPKGVILTHHNFMTTVKAVFTIITDEIIREYYRHCWYAYLPLAHILEFIAEMLLFCSGIRIGYGNPFTMTDLSTGVLAGQKGDLTLLQPTIFPGVPLVLERVRKQIMEKFEGKNKSPSFLKILVLELAKHKNERLECGFETPLFNQLVSRLFQEPFGGRLEYMLIGGAPLSSETQRMMRALLNVKILIGYGSTEACGANLVMDMDDTSIGHTGAPLFGVKARLVEWEEGGYTPSDHPHPRGELHIGGGVVSIGYLKQDELTKESFYDENGVHWFRTGDIAEVNQLGIFRIIDRRKDLVKLQHGEYVSLGKVEAELKNCILLDNVCVHACAKYTYTVALLVPNWNQLRLLASRSGIVIQDLSNNEEREQLCANQDLVQTVSEELIKFCQKETKLSKVEIPQRVVLCPDDWTVENKMVTASLKLKRVEIYLHYATQIEMAYANHEVFPPSTPNSC